MLSVTLLKVPADNAFCVKPELTQSFERLITQLLTEFFSFLFHRATHNGKETGEEDRPSEHKRKDGLQPESQPKWSDYAIQTVIRAVASRVTASLRSVNQPVLV